MRIIMIFMIILLCMSALFITACGNGDDEDNNTTNTPLGYEDLTPSVAEWAVMFIGFNGKTSYQVGAYWIGGNNVPQVTDTASLLVNGNAVEITSYAPGIWYGTCIANAGQANTVKFVYNDVTKINTSINLVNLITGSNFPASYNPAQSASFSWTLAANNEHQVAGVSAYKSNYPTADDYSDEYMQEIDVAARSFTVPANPISGVPSGASYSMGVSEVNYLIQNKIAVMSVSGAWSEEYVKNMKQDGVSHFAGQLLKTLEK